MKKIWVSLWTCLGVAIGIFVVLWTLPLWMSGDILRERIEVALSDALGREVTIEEVRVSSEVPLVELRGVTVAQPSGWPSTRGPMLHAEHVFLEGDVLDLLRRRVTGTATARGVSVVILKRQGSTSAHGLGGASSEGEGGKLNVALALSELSLEFVDLEKSEEVRLRDALLLGHLSDSADQAGVFLQGNLDVLGVEVRALQMQVRAHDSTIHLSRMRAAVGARGRIEGSGRLLLGGETNDWSFQLAATDLEMEGPLRVAAAHVLPVLTLVGNAHPTRGLVDLVVTVEGKGFDWRSMAPSMRGSASLRARDVVVSSDSTLLRAASLAGHKPGPWSPENVGAMVRVGEGWIHLDAMTLGDLRLRTMGRVSLHGELDVGVDLLPVIELLDADLHAKVSRVTSSLPVRMVGTVRKPELAPPRTLDVASGLLGGTLRRALNPR